MSENKKITTKSKNINFEEKIMGKVMSKKVIMKPKMYFVLGSILSILGLIGLSIGAVFLTNITLFLFRRRGFMSHWRMEIILEEFPWWIPALALIGIIVGIWVLKKYDFSYKKNFVLIVVSFIVSIIIAAWFIDYLGLNEVWSRRGPARGFYQHLERGFYQESWKTPGDVKGVKRTPQRKNSN